MLAEVKHSNGSIKLFTCLVLVSLAIKLFTCLVLVSLATPESPRKMLPCNVALPQSCQHWA